MPALQVRNCPSDIYEGLQGVAQESECSLTHAAILVLREGLGARNESRQKATRMQKRQDAFTAFDAMNEMRLEDSALDPVKVIRAARSERTQALDNVIANVAARRDA